MEIVAILAMDANNGIGLKNKLPWNIKEEMNFFKEKTINNIVVMGKNTFKSLKKPLKDRINIVLTNDRDFIEELEQKKITDKNYENTYVKNDFEFLKEMKRENSLNKKVFIIGGKKIYEQILDECDSVYLSIINDLYFCDTFMDYNFEEKFEVKDIKVFKDFTNYFLTKKKHLNF